MDPRKYLLKTLDSTKTLRKIETQDSFLIGNYGSKEVLFWCFILKINAMIFELLILSPKSLKNIVNRLLQRDNKLLILSPHLKIKFFDF